MSEMHFTGTIWRPPYEAQSSLLQITIGCSHHKCKFCSLYPGLKFKPSPMSEIESDLMLMQRYAPNTRRIFLVGANPFVLSYNKLLELGFLIRKYLPKCQDIGTFARITDIKSKTIQELKNLRHLGFNGISIGTESGDDLTLSLMNKGTNSKEMIEQCKKLEEANIEYYVSYLTGLAGKGNGERNALASAHFFNEIHPFIISVVSLTIFPDSELYTEVQRGEFLEATEYERINELQTLVSNLNNTTNFFANTVSNPVPLSGILPKDRMMLLRELENIKMNFEESDLALYRKTLPSL